MCDFLAAGHFPQPHRVVLLTEGNQCLEIRGNGRGNELSLFVPIEVVDFLAAGHVHQPHLLRTADSHCLAVWRKGDGEEYLASRLEEGQIKLWGWF